MSVRTLLRCSAPIHIAARTSIWGSNQQFAKALRFTTRPSRCFQNVARRKVASTSETVAEGDGSNLSSTDEADVSKLDIRVGKIVDVEAHPDADTLYVEQIDVGEAEGPRTIVSGLRKYITLEDLKGQNVLILANLKPRNMRGIKSNGMVLCASNEEHTIVEPLGPPEGATIGERVFFGEDGSQQDDPAAPNQLQKKKYWESCQPCLKTDTNCVANFKGKPMLTSAGPVTSKTLRNANIS